MSDGIEVHCTADILLNAGYNIPARKVLNSYLTSAFIVLLKCVGFVHHWTHVFVLTHADVSVDSADEGKIVRIYSHSGQLTQLWFPPLSS